MCGIFGFLGKCEHSTELYDAYLSETNMNDGLFYVNEDDELRELDLVSPPGVHVTGFGRDDNGEVYVVGSTGIGVLAAGQGSLLKIIPVETEEDICFPIKAANGAVPVICL